MPLGKRIAEPVITINGHLLSEGEAMTVRVAVVDFYVSIKAHGLGRDQHGLDMAASYIINCDALQKKMGV